MTLLVQKFGGTSVGNVERIQEIAKRIASSKEQGNELVIVVSAMTGLFINNSAAHKYLFIA